MPGEIPRIADALRMLERAGIAATPADVARIEGFLTRLRQVPAPAPTSDPWALPRTERWPHD